MQRPGTGPAPAGRRIAFRCAVLAGVLAAYLELEWISFIHEYKGLPVTPWNPGLGVVFALMVYVGPAGGLVLFAGVIAAEAVVLDTDLQWSVVVGLAALTATSYAVIAGLARRALGLDSTLSHLRDVLILLSGGLVGAVASGTLMTALLIAVGTLDWRDLSNASLPLMVGDVIGIAVVTPLLLRFVILRRHWASVAMAVATLEAMLVATVILVVLFVVMAGAGDSGHKLFYLLFLPVVAAALRRGLDGACVALATAQFGLVALLHLRGYDAQVFTDFQAQMLVLTATGLIVGVAVTERRHADHLAREAQARLKQKESEAAQAARFNLVSGMASALAHEITQPMTAARALARSVQHILRMPDGDLKRADANVTTMIAQIDHAGDVLRHVRDFLRRGTPQRSAIGLRGVIDEAMVLVQAEALTHDVVVVRSIEDGLPALHGDPIQLQQVLVNLVRNAIDAVAAGGRAGKVVISARRQDDPAGVELAVTDDGPGVPLDMVDRLFQPLATSKNEGLGLGLSICASIIGAHGGRIWLHCADAGRTEFRLFLPSSPPATT
jgi:two-component system, LuxR family, sensor kinase FixL